ncbi:MAG: amidohydrolase [Chitinophagales bacterium]|nr:amidohydrolase [Chitinophagaceae bacterium]MCB9063933.1 amidohydrolase [Chitinophagales bacterium]
MPEPQLNFTLIQPNIVWEDKQANLDRYTKYIEDVKDKKEIIVLPEMFSTGFSMAPERLAEPMSGASVQWMKDMAAKHRCILTGSLIIEEEGKYYNRMLWVQPDGYVYHYDKRHLFGYADEDKHYNAGDRRLIVSVKGFRICLMVCYDLRFPVWSRNQNEEYDVLLYVANWPERRSLPWKALLQARAIENMSYVIGLNRVGEDGNGISYSGDSSVFSPLGELLWQKSQNPVCETVTIDKEQVTTARAQFGFLKDADDFAIGL